MAQTGVIERKRIKRATKTIATSNNKSVDTTSVIFNGRVKKTEDLTRTPYKTKEFNYIPRKDFLDTYELPSDDKKTSLTLISRDPNWIHAYWEIAPQSIETLRENLKSDFERIHYILRMYDVTCVHFNGNNANNWFDIHFDPKHTNNWYINLWCDNVTYCSELGASLPDGNFIPIARSNIVTTPKKAPSDRFDEIWMNVDDDSSGAPFIVAEYKEDIKRPRGHSQSPSRRRIYLSEDDIKNYYSKLSPLLRDILAKRLKEFNLYKDKKGYLDKIIMRGSRKHFIKRLLLGASEELTIEGGASEYLGASEAASVREAMKRKFFFEIGTELIVYGRTESDAKVYLGNKNIPLKNDGTFSLRFALPEGNIPLQFSAHSKNGIDKRTIETSVLRSKTKYDE